jgi:hypothetical protein
VAYIGTNTGTTNGEILIICQNGMTILWEIIAGHEFSLISDTICYVFIFLFIGNYSIFI